MTTSAGRIPASLQAIFMASNAGQEVYVPPTDKSANMVFSSQFQQQHSSRPPRPNQQPQNHQQQENVLQVKKSKKRLVNVPPQAKFHLLLKERGYFPRNYSAKRSGYSNHPSAHQLASYGSEILAVVKQNRVHEFRNMLECGLSPNACNAHGESLLHMVCRHGKVNLFRILIAYDVDVQQTDDYGRTPMHDACWAANPSFEIARYLMLRDPTMMSLFDARGSLPLSYVTKSLWSAWNAFLDDIVNQIWTARSAADKNNNSFIKDNNNNALCTMKPDSRPVPDPKHKLPAHLATLVANGQLQPFQALQHMAKMAAAEEEDDEDATTVMTQSESQFDDHDEEDDSYYYSSSDSSDSDSDSDDDWDSSDDDDQAEEEEEEEELMEMVGHLTLDTVQE